MNKKYKKLVITFVIMLTMVLAANYFKVINLKELVDASKEDLHWNLITINTVLSGFMFTSLGLIISVMQSETVMRLEKAHLMDSIYINITTGIFFSIISIILSLIVIFIIPNCNLLLLEKSAALAEFIVQTAIPFLIMFTLLMVLGCFFNSVVDIRFIIDSIRSKLNKRSISEEKIASELKKIRK